MYDKQIPPTLELSRTISHPLEDVRVIGFEGRDTTYGRHAVILKGDAVPTGDRQEGSYVKTMVAIPERVRRLMEEEDRFLYVLQETRVRAAGPEKIEEAERAEFETHYGDVEFQALNMEAFTTYSSDRVEVGSA